ncbi:Phosphoglycerol transferase MdoB [Lachnospiraceae bacterium XBB2008]|nr:Phosphoglycerol transferase MdoB [Lachnospiraceae bacterium XBB2008]
MIEKQIKHSFVENVYIIVISFLEFLFLQVSITVFDYHLSVPIILLNLCILIILNETIAFFIDTYILGMISLSVSGLWSIACYYTVLYHGMPLTFGELKNLGTAMGVLASYEFRIEKCPLTVLCVAVLGIIASGFMRKRIKSHSFNKSSYIVGMMIWSVSLIYILFSYFLANPVRPKYVINWSWKEAYGTYGYLTCLIEDIYSRKDIFIEPSGYDRKYLEEVCENYKIDNKISLDNETLMNRDYPDIILILNESLYDLKWVVDMETDSDYFMNIHSLDGLLYGYSVVPYIAGGTNCSEYELLTSNSLSMMRSGITPFNVINLDCSNSIVSHLGCIGYDTLGTHTEPKNNYNRGYAYNALGFNSVKFDNDYSELEYYGNRWFESDESVYKNVEEWYEEMDSSSPRFIYLLTIQNHGNYDENNEEYDTVHVVNYQGDNESLINEYLTCISQTDEAFYDFARYFCTSDRRVILCMLGDHCPPFAPALLDDYKTDYEGSNIRLRETPLFIWANYDLDVDDYNLGEISMIDIIPKLLDIADVPKSYYYDYIYNMQQRIPILTADGYCFKNSAERIDLSQNDELSDYLEKYYYMEYNNVATSNKIEWFYN